jgi:hypothetical protein
MTAHRIDVPFADERVLAIIDAVVAGRKGPDLKGP